MLHDIPQHRLNTDLVACTPDLYVLNRKQSWVQSGERLTRTPHILRYKVWAERREKLHRLMWNVHAKHKWWRLLDSYLEPLYNSPVYVTTRLCLLKSGSWRDLSDPIEPAPPFSLRPASRSCACESVLLFTRIRFHAFMIFPHYDTAKAMYNMPN